MKRWMIMGVGVLGAAVAALCLGICIEHGISKNINLPYKVRQTPLVMLELRSYDGVFLEDGNLREVQGVAAVVIQNTGECLVENGSLRIRQGNVILVFVFTMLPPGAKLLIPECTEQLFVCDQIDACWGVCFFGSRDGRVSVVEVGRSMLKISNTTGELATNVVVYYKFYDEVERQYVGGFSFSIHLDRLEPGKCDIRPAFWYISGQSKVIQ